MRLIDADELLKDLNEAKIPFNADINSFIISAPTIDAEPVVYCKNCVHNIKRYGMKVCAILGRQTSNNFYCYYGVAKTDEEK